MAKQKKHDYGKAPWDLKNGDISNYAQITEANRKNAIVLGRILYVVEKNGRTHQFCGTFSIDPRFTKGWIGYPIKPWEQGYPGHRRVYMPEDLNYEEWKSNNDKMITTFIQEKKLFIKTDDPILTYTKE